jgi:hypothetical protein
MKQGTCKGACTCCGATVRRNAAASRSANSISVQHLMLTCYQSQPAIECIGSSTACELSRR